MIEKGMAVYGQLLMWAMIALAVGAGVLLVLGPALWAKNHL